jgi:hypothetical protein
VQEEGADRWEDWGLSQGTESTPFLPFHLFTFPLSLLVVWDASQECWQPSVSLTEKRSDSVDWYTSDTSDIREDLSEV